MCRLLMLDMSSLAQGHLELPDETRKVFRIARQRVACRIGLLYHRGILLRDLVHLADGRIDLAQSDRLFSRAGNDCLNMLVNS